MFFELLALSSEQWAGTRYLRNVFALLIAHCPLLITQSRRRCKPYDLTTPKYTPKGGIQGWGRANNDEHVFFEASLSLRKTTSPQDYKSVEAITHCLMDW